METLYFTQELVPAHAISLTEMVETFLAYHPNKDKGSVYGIKQAFRIMLEMFQAAKKPIPDTSTFKPGYLAWFKKTLIAKNYERSQVERFLMFVKQVFSWGGEARFDELGGTWDTIPAFVSSTLIAEMKTVKCTDKDDIRENEKRLDVPYEYIEDVMHYVQQMTAHKMRIQYLTGLRPGEVCKMTVGKIKKTKAEFGKHYRLYDGESWLYTLDKHKTRKHIGLRQFALGLEEQDILAPYLEGKEDTDFVFTKPNGKPQTREEYSEEIRLAIEENNLEKFTPNQIKHKSLSDISEKYGRDKARSQAGHTNEKTTAIYDHSDLKKIFSIAHDRNVAYRARKDHNAAYCTQNGGNFAATPFQLRIYNG